MWDLAAGGSADKMPAECEDCPRRGFCKLRAKLIHDSCTAPASRVIDSGSSSSTAKRRRERVLDLPRIGRARWQEGASVTRALLLLGLVGAVGAASCAAGTYSTDGTDTAGACIACNAGSFTGQTGTAATSCSPCPAGLYSTASNIVTCITCDAGSKTDTGTSNGAISCTQCAADCSIVV